MNLISLKGNTKLGSSVTTTTLPIRATCSTDCIHHPDRESTCYAYQGPMMWHQRRLERTLDPATDIGGLEANQLKAHAKSGSLVRLHVAGEWTSSRHIKSVAAVVRRKTLRAWTYTHKWRQFRSTAFKGISTLASCDSLAETALAWVRGYAAALVVPSFERATAYPLGNGMTGIPCPAQTKPSITCQSCQLCLKTDWLHATKRVILFEAHGSRQKHLKQTLIQIS